MDAQGFEGYNGDFGNNSCSCKREECKCRGTTFALKARMPHTRSRASGYESGKAATSKR